MKADNPGPGGARPTPTLESQAAPPSLFIQSVFEKLCFTGTLISQAVQGDACLRVYLVCSLSTWGGWSR